MNSHIKNTTSQVSDAFAYSMTKFFRFIADSFFLQRYGHRAVVLETVAGVNFIEYRAKLVERFSNPYIKDTLARLALDGSQKFEATLGLSLIHI